MVGIVYEGRPNVTVDAFGLTLKSGNAVILRGGSDSFRSSSAICAALLDGVKKAGSTESDAVVAALLDTLRHDTNVNVRLAAIPEPSVILLSGLGLLGVLRRRRA